MRQAKKVLLFSTILISLYISVISKPTRRYRYDADFLDSEIQRIRSGKAAEIEPNWAQNETETEKVEASPETTSDEDGSESTSTSQDYYSSSEEIDVTCAPDKGWHIRGQRCVPLNCPGGPAERDFNTGECLYAAQQPRGRFTKPFQQWNDLNHVYRSSPMSTHFVRSMILMRKG